MFLHDTGTNTNMSQFRRTVTRGEAEAVPTNVKVTFDFMPAMNASGKRVMKVNQQKMISKCLERFPSMGTGVRMNVLENREAGYRKYETLQSMSRHLPSPSELHGFLKANNLTMRVKINRGGKARDTHFALRPRDLKSYMSGNALALRAEADVFEGRAGSGQVVFYRNTDGTLGTMNYEVTIEHDNACQQPLGTAQ